MFETVPYAVFYFNDPGSPVDITNYIVSVSLKRQGTGRIRAASMMLDAFNGQFVTDSRSGTTPIIEDFDRIKIMFNDGKNTKSSILEVDQRLPQITVAGKTLFPIELLGRERALRDIKLPAFFRFKDPHTALNKLQDRYNAQRGTLQPAWSFTDPITFADTNEAPTNIPNIFDFAQGMSYYDCIMQIIARLNQPTTLNGSGTFWSCTIEDDETEGPNAPTITIRIHEQGKTAGEIPIIESTETDPFHKVTGTRNTPTGTQVLVRGTPNTGFMPPDLHRYISYVEAINNLPDWDNITIYPPGLYVKVGNLIFQALGLVPAGINPVGNGLYWLPVTAQNVIDTYIASDYKNWDATLTYGIKSRVSYQNIAYEAQDNVPVNIPPPTDPVKWKRLTINYSLWTNNKVFVTKNQCSNPDHSFPISEWNSEKNYPAGEQVVYQGQVYTSEGGIPIGTVPLGNPLYWLPNGPYVPQIGFVLPAFPDGNLVIRDRLDPSTNDYKFYRDFAWVRAVNDANIIGDPRMKQYLMGKNQDTFYKGFTVLVDSTLGNVGGSFVGVDKFGRLFLDSIAQFDGEQWIVQRTPNVGDECAILLEGKVYEYNVTPVNSQLYFGNQFATQIYSPRFRGPNATLKWQDISGAPGANDCFHAPDSIESVQGLIPTLINGQDYSSYVANSAIKVSYKYNLASAVYQSGKTLIDKIFQNVSTFFASLGQGQINTQFTLSAAELALPVEEQWYNYGWWYWIPFPYPFSTFNGISEKVGDFYGGNDFTASEFAALDLQNSDFTHSGLSGYNNPEVSDLGGPFTGLKFWFKFDILINGDRQFFQGDLPFTVTIYDDVRNVWRADFTYRLLGDAQEINIPFSDFTVSRPSRMPFHINALADIIDLVAVSEIEILSIFDEKRVRGISIQFGQSYDQFLRYMPVGIDNFLRTPAGVGTVQMVGIIDGLGLTKAPFVSSGEVDDRVINPDIIEVPNVRNYLQLKGIALAEKDIHGFPFQQYVIERNGNCSYDVEQSVYIKNQDIMKDSDKTGVPNTNKLILMSDELSYDEVRGFISTQTVAKRLGGP